MNNKGQLFLVGVMVALFVFATAVILMTPLKEFITEARDVNHLDCDNTTLTTGTAATCLVVDLYLPYFIGVVLAVSVGLMVANRKEG